MREVNGLPLIEYVLRRAAAIRGIEQVVLATSDRPVDEPLCKYARERGFAAYRGPLDNVTHRAVMCAEDFGADYFLRINGDSPWLDSRLAMSALPYCDGQTDLVTNLIGRTFPYGIAVEIVRTAALRRKLPTLLPEEREHVTSHIYNNLRDFLVHDMRSPRIEIASTRLTVDSEADLRNFETCVRALGDGTWSADYITAAQTYLELCPNDQLVLHPA
jgi:spore coat polysaccharide biosynthesis protein SpsF